MSEITFGALVRVAKRYTYNPLERLGAVRAACVDRHLLDIMRHIDSFGLQCPHWPKTDAGTLAYHAVVVWIMERELDAESENGDDV